MSIYESAVFTVSSSKLDNLPPASVPEIAFAGRSNAGKSTAINTLTRQGKLAFASKTPGRTQLINFFELATKDKVTTNGIPSRISSTFRATATRRPRRTSVPPGLTSSAATSRSAARCLASCSSWMPAVRSCPPTNG